MCKKVTVSRGFGEVSHLQEAIPDWIAVIIGLLTQLGDPWFLILILAILYWSKPALQEDALLVMGMYVAGLGLYRYLKFIFELPRPEEPLLDPAFVPWIIRPLYEATAFASSYGFPSGHATSATIVYVGLATVLTAGTAKGRYAAAIGLVGLIGFTRIALGVHFFVDIVVGVALGGLVVVVTFYGLRFIPFDRVTAVLAFAIVTSALYLFKSEAHPEAVHAFGLALGLFAGWQVVVLARQLVGYKPSGWSMLIAARGGLASVIFVLFVGVLGWFSVIGGEPFPLGSVTGIGAAVAVILPIARYSSRVTTICSWGILWASSMLKTVRVSAQRVLSYFRF